MASLSGNLSVSQLAVRRSHSTGSKNHTNQCPILERHLQACPSWQQRSSAQSVLTDEQIQILNSHGVNAKFAQSLRSSECSGPLLALLSSTASDQQLVSDWLRVTGSTSRQHSEDLADPNQTHGTAGAEHNFQYRSLPIDQCPYDLAVSSFDQFDVGTALNQLTSNTVGTSLGALVETDSYQSQTFTDDHYSPLVTLNLPDMNTHVAKSSPKHKFEVYRPIESGQFDDSKFRCLRFGCKESYRNSSSFREHFYTKHVRSHVFFCKHQNCREWNCSKSIMKRHHTQIHKPRGCPNEDACVTSKELPSATRVWGCPCCIFYTVDPEVFLEHHKECHIQTSHTSKQSEMSINTHMVSLISQPLTRSFWDKLVERYKAQHHLRQISLDWMQNMLTQENGEVVLREVVRSLESHLFEGVDVTKDQQKCIKLVKKAFLLGCNSGEPTIVRSHHAPQPLSKYHQQSSLSQIDPASFNAYFDPQAAVSANDLLRQAMPMRHRGEPTIRHQPSAMSIDEPQSNSFLTTQLDSTHGRDFYGSTNYQSSSFDEFT